MGFIGTWIATAVATAVAVWLIPGIETIGGSLAGPIFTALVLGILNATIKPVADVLSLPIKILTLGIFSLILNAIFLELASYLSRNIFHAGVAVDSFGAAFFGAIVISIVSAVVSAVIG
jgi:putative membrane protein